MNFRQQRSKIFLFASSIFLMLTLASLTISLPFVYAAKQMIELNDAASTNILLDENEEGSDNPFANSTEEKAPGSVNTASEEYLHDMHSAEQYLAALVKEYKVEQVSIYNAFIGELISPPPDVA
jgi:hypothetical protein